MCTSKFSKGDLMQSVLTNAPGGSQRQHQGKRIYLHELGSWCCSIVGTCLTHEDLLVLARKWNIKMGPEARMFDVPQSTAIQSAYVLSPLMRLGMTRKAWENQAGRSGRLA